MKWTTLLVLLLGTACDNRNPAPEAALTPASGSKGTGSNGTGSKSLTEQPGQKAMAAAVPGLHEDVREHEDVAEIDGDVIDRKVEDRLTLSGGIYGQTTAQDDVGAYNPVEYLSMSIGVFAHFGKGSALTTVQSDEVGFYQIPLAPGAYSLCTSFKRCTKVRVKAGECTRLDYEFSLSIGWSRPKVIACPAK
jgi:hypothetical protein